MSIQGAAHRGSIRAVRGAQAAAFSVALHGAALAVLLGWYVPGPNPTTDPSAVAGTEPVVNWVDLIPGDLPAEEDAESQRRSPVLEVVSRDQAFGGLPTVTVSSAIPSADSGQAVGKPLPPAFRRDRSTLHVQLSNGARTYQAEHERTSRVASSNQAERREPVVGRGDLAKTQRLAQDEVLSSPQLQAGIAETPSSGAEGQDEQKAVLGGDVAGQGPLAAEQGERRFDVDRLGPARDVRLQPARSDELRPGRMDLAAVSAPGPHDGELGRGPGDTPGVLPRPSSGRAAMVSTRVTGTANADGPGDRQRALRELEIRRRIGQYLRFPRRLALMLEQGETIVAFVVDAGGQVVGGIRVVKSAGFAEFDEEAVSAVRRAAPFAPPGRALALSVRVPFQNPLVR